MMQDMMKQCCGANGMPDVEKMKAMMEECGCMVSESATESKKVDEIPSHQPTR